MSRRILPLLALACLLWAGQVEARTATARIAALRTPVATLRDVTVTLHWPDGAGQGALSIRAQALDAPDLGYRFREVRWQCPLQRTGEDGWRCDGVVHAGKARPLRLSLAVDAAITEAALTGNRSRFALYRNAASPDLTRLDLTRIPVAWVQALVAQAWPAANLTAGMLEGRLDVEAPAHGPLRAAGPLRVEALSLDTPDGSIAAEKLSARLDVDYRSLPNGTLVTVDGDLLGGEVLAGNAYIALPATPVALSLAAEQQRDSGWRLPQVRWNDGDALQVSGAMEFDSALALRQADLQLRSADISPLRDRYLSGWLGLAGLGGLRMQGALSAEIGVHGGDLHRVRTALQDVGLHDARDRFRLEGLDGGLAYSADEPLDSTLRWRSGDLHGLPFGAAGFPLRSAGGVLSLRQAVAVPMLGGELQFDALNLRPPAGGQGMAFDFGLALQRLDVGQLAKAMDWPAFQGDLSGRIPRVRYADDQLNFDGTLTAHAFGGTVQASGLSMERPFGTAPTLSADIALDDLDLQSLTGVFGFGEITGALDGHVRGLRLVDWSAQAFDADLHTDTTWRGRQRISQRAVQDLSSVGGGDGLGSSLQAQALKLFDDFGYRRIGIRCRLAQAVCGMDGLGSAGNGFIIVEGSGLPRLTVVGYNRRVDWPTLVERLVAVTQGESTPVFE